MLLSMPSALAGQDADWKGWFIDLDAALATPGNTNTPLQANSPGTLAQAGTSDLSSEVEFMDWDDDAALGFGFGYSWGSRGAIQVTYWEYSDTAEGSGSSIYYPNYNWFTIGPTSAWSYPGFPTAIFDMNWDFEQEIEARTVDVEFKRSVSTKNPLTIGWSVGLRWASFEDTVDGEYLVDGLFRFPAMRHIESDGVGATGSFEAGYDFAKAFGLSTDLRVGFITADVDGEHEIIDLDGFYAYPGVSWSEEVGSEDEVATTLDFNFNLTFHAGRYLDIDLGYLYSTWTEMAEVNLSRAESFDDFSFSVPPTIKGEDRDRITWSGPRIRLRWLFPG